MVRKSRERIVADILKIALEAGEGGVVRTEVLYRANLSFHQLKCYLNGMKEVKLLEEGPTNRPGAKAVYKPTDEGKEYVEKSKFTLGKLGELEEAMEKFKKKNR